MLVFSRHMLLGPSLEDCFLSAVIVYLILAQSPQISMFVVRPLHPQAEDTPSCGDRIQQILVHYIFRYTCIVCPQIRHCEISLLYLIGNVKQSTIYQKQISVPHIFTGRNLSEPCTNLGSPKYIKERRGICLYER
jgi:hypothetical protein